jgi:hypothetical protein
MTLSMMLDFLTSMLTHIYSALPIIFINYEDKCPVPRCQKETVYIIFVCKNVPSSTEQFTYVNNEKNLM